MSANIEADYLVVGAGGMGLAFTDVLLSRSQSTVVIVDRFDKPGGHWNHAYPFVRLHQPSAFYGVHSLELGSGRIDEIGRNRGMLELASGHEVVSYFERVMRQVFLPTGRVQYFPMCEYLGEGRFRARASGETRQVSAAKHVDATFMKVKVPQIEPPRFEVAAGVECVPPNALTRLEQAYEHYVVIGGGKTGIDACLYLLDVGVPTDRISWIVPRDAWLLAREKVQPDNLMANILDQITAIAGSTSLSDMFARLEAIEQLFRFDPSVEPTMYRCATVSRAELEDLRAIRDVVRLGRVLALALGHMTLERGTRDYPANTLFVNCTSDALEKRPTCPVFAGRSITLQAVRPCQQIFSAAFIGYVESLDADEETKNALCRPTPHPDGLHDYIHWTEEILRAELQWAADPRILEWLTQSRVDGFTTPEVAAFLATLREPSAAPTLATIENALVKMRLYLEDEPAA